MMNGSRGIRIARAVGRLADRPHKFARKDSRQFSSIVDGNGIESRSNKSFSKVGAYISGEQTHFGFKDVRVEDKETEVKKVFSSVAESYDVMNDLMSAGLHRWWKDELLRMSGVEAISKTVRKSPSSRRLDILDVAGGTGDVAFRFVEAANCVERSKSSGEDPVTITVCDINPSMLEVGEQRARKRFGNDILQNTKSLSFVEGNAQRLPFADNQFDLYTIAFGLRNVTDVDEAILEAKRVLRPGGKMMILEFSKVTNDTFRAIYDFYSFNIIPQIGETVANDRSSYQYLVESIRKFNDQESLEARMQKQGFLETKYTNFTGGIVAIHEGYKPLES